MYCSFLCLWIEISRESFHQICDEIEPSILRWLELATSPLYSFFFLIETLLDSPITYVSLSIFFVFGLLPLPDFLLYFFL